MFFRGVETTNQWVVGWCWGFLWFSMAVKRFGGLGWRVWDYLMGVLIRSYGVDWILWEDAFYIILWDYGWVDKNITPTIMGVCPEQILRGRRAGGELLDSQGHRLDLPKSSETCRFSEVLPGTMARCGRCSRFSRFRMGKGALSVLGNSDGSLETGICFGCFLYFSWSPWDGRASFLTFVDHVISRNLFWHILRLIHSHRSPKHLDVQ